MMFKGKLPRRFMCYYTASIVSCSVISILLSFLFFSSYSHKYKPQICHRSKSEKTIKYESIDDITFITVPKTGMNKKIYKKNKLAISSWLSVSNKSKVILFVKRDEFDPSDKFPKDMEDLFGKDRITYAGPIRSDLKDVPFIDDWFVRGVAEAESKYVCFINGDIVLSSGWLKRVKQVYKALTGKPLVLIGQRIDFDLTDSAYHSLDFKSTSLLKQIDKIVEKSNHTMHSPYGVDTFTFRIDEIPFNPLKIQPFIIGRYNWDNWFVGWLNTFAETVSFGSSPPIYHINHERHPFDPNDDRVAINHHIRQANGKYFGSNVDTKWHISGNTLKQRYGTMRFDLSKL